MKEDKLIIYALFVLVMIMAVITAWTLYVTR